MFRHITLGFILFIPFALGKLLLQHFALFCNVKIFILGIQYVQVGGHNRGQFPPMTELYDTDTDTTCAQPQTFYNFTSNEDDIGGNFNKNMYFSLYHLHRHF